MAKCAYCGSIILFGGETDETGRYCNAECQQGGYLTLIAQQIPQETLETLTHQVHQGDCPRCNGTGPIDVHKAHKVTSLLIFTSWSSNPELSCKRCGVKRQIGAIFYSMFLGWWGFPWGLIMTPTQVIKNWIEILGGPKPGNPSPLLQKVVSIQAAASLQEQAAAESHAQNLS